MALLHLTDINLNKNALQFASLHPLTDATSLTNPVEGQVYYDTTDNVVKAYGGSAWNNLDSITTATLDGTTLKLSKDSGLTDVTVDLGTLHPTISAANTSDNSGRTYIQDITLDSNGHVIGIETATETVVDTDTTYTLPVTNSVAPNPGTTGGSANITLTDSTTPTPVTDSVQIIGTDEEVHVTGNNTNDTIQIGLPDDVTITGDLTVNGGNINSNAAQLNISPNGGTASGATVRINGDLDVVGAVNYVSSSEIQVEDTFIKLNSALDSGTSASVNAGITVERGADADRSLRWNEADDAWEIQASDGTYYPIQYQTTTSPVQSVTITEGTGISVTDESSGGDASFQIDADAATAEAAGIVELATTAEATIGTDATRAVTPAGLAAWGGARSYAANISASGAVTHSLDSRDVIVQLYDVSTYDTVYADVQRNSLDQVTITFNATPVNSVRVLVTLID
jgi:hypothetical protein